MLRFCHLLLILSATRTAAYDYGEDVTLCWAKRCGPMCKTRSNNKPWPASASQPASLNQCHNF
jgi:hypothetical protein